jgi:malate dehydrogenase (oxaloacetate-decarboxylating)(NADP+)
VMEGKAVLFKRFADVDSIDIEIDAVTVDEIVNAVRYLGPTFGGINLEDIKAPECFIVEQRLRELMDIPVFHDDQHGTAIIAAAGIINALDLTGKKFEDLKVVVNGAGAAGIACLELIKAMGLPHDNAILCDTKGTIFKGRTENMNQWKSAHAAETEDRTLLDAMTGADVFLGLSVKGAVTREMVEKMNDKPVIFAMANPDPEITPEEVAEIRDDAIMATGRSDYPNQINNVLGFPYIFRGALDVRATTINDEMKIAAANAIAELAREDVPDEVAAAYSGPRPSYGPNYIIPAPFDPRLIRNIPIAVANAAMATGVAKKPIVDIEGYSQELSARLDPTADALQGIFESVRANPKRMVFAEGEEEKVIRAAVTYLNLGLGTPVLIGSTETINKTLREVGLDPKEKLEIHDTALNEEPNEEYFEYLYNRLQRKGYLQRDVARMVRTDRNIIGACMVAVGHADGLITGTTRQYHSAFEDISRVIDPIEDELVFGLSMALARDKTVFIADTNIHETPTAQELAMMAIKAANVASHFGHTPRVAFCSFSNFGQPPRAASERLSQAVEIMKQQNVTFEFDGEMAADVALNGELATLYPFSRLSGPANVLIMPNLDAANISVKLLRELGGSTVIAPLLVGLQKPATIVRMGATVSDLVNMAALSAFDLSR